MQPRANFELIHTPDPEIFAIKISGHLTPRQKGVVEQLIEKCIAAGKTKVLFEFSDLESLGGGVAQMLGEFAIKLEKDGCAPRFVGASEIVRKFLTARFGEGEPCYADTLEEATAAMGGAPARTQKTKPKRDESKSTVPARSSEMKVSARHPAVSGLVRVVPPSEEKPSEDKPADEELSESTHSDAVASEQKNEGEDFLEIVEAVNDTASGQAAEAPPAPPKSVAAKAGPGGYISLDEALAELTKMSSLAAAAPILARLLHSSSLAHRSFLFLRNSNGFSHENLHFSHDGAFATVVESRRGPIDLVDLVELDLQDEEVEVLEELNCQACVPFFGPKQLEGICFLSKVQAGDEYSAAETFGLESVSRQVSEALWSESAKAPAGESAGQARRNRNLQSIARQLHDSTDEESILSRLAHGLIGEMGIRGVAALELDDDGMTVTGIWGQGTPAIQNWGTVSADAWDGVREPGNLEQFSGDWAVSLKDTGCSWFAPLGGGRAVRRALAFSLKDPGNDESLDHEAIESVAAQAGFALDHIDALESARGRTLLVSKTLVTLIERRLGQQSGAETDVVAEYVARLAERMNVDRLELPDLLYGTIMRDVGMIEISDLVLKSPRKLTPEEWKLVQRHPIAGAEILRGMGFNETACEVVQHHHERFNGQGYPHGLRGTAIPVGARMVSVVESYVAMLRETPYRPALSEDEALSVLQENWEMRYDPNVIEQFIQLKQVEQSPVDLDKLLVGQTPG